MNNKKHKNRKVQQKRQQQVAVNKSPNKQKNTQQIKKVKKEESVKRAQEHKNPNNTISFKKKPENLLKLVIRSFKDNKKPFDRKILITTFILLFFGLIMLYSASYIVALNRFHDTEHYLKDQAKYAVIGIFTMLMASRFDYRTFKDKRIINLFLKITFILLIVVLFMPAIKGCKRWIIIPGVLSFQPSEITKLFVIVYFSSLTETLQHPIINKKGKEIPKIKDFKQGLCPYMIMFACIAGCMFLQPHLSATIIMFGITVIIMFIGGVPIIYFAAVAIAAVIGLSIIFLKPDLIPYASTRIDLWLHPEKDLQGAGYQSYQSLVAIGSGGFFGKGLGESTQKHMFLPEPQNDFVFSVICEELGFVGGIAVIVLFTILFVQIFRVAFKSEDMFGCLVAVGIGSQIFIQALLNIAVATNTIPNTGISLPFFSEGGTSLIMLLGEIGIVLNISRHSIENNNLKIHKEDTID